MKVLIEQAAVFPALTLRVYLVVPGILLALAGGTFTLQGLGVVGPSSSFMYQSTTWIYDGVAALVVGLVLIVGGLWKGRSQRAG